MNVKPTGFEMQLIGIRDYAGLSDDDKAALDALSAAERNYLHAARAYGNAARRALGGVRLAQVKDAIHELRPDVVITARWHADGVTLTVARSDEEQIVIDGFTREGDGGHDATAVALNVAESLSPSAPLVGFPADSAVRANAHPNAVFADPPDVPAVVVEGSTAGENTEA